MSLVAVVGSANVDLVARAPRLPGPGETVLGTEFFEAPGGKGLNQAVAAARAGASVSFIANVGRDAAARIVTAVLEADGIDADAVDVVDRPTGRALIGVSDAGENSIIVVPGANACLSPASITVHGPLLARATVVLAQLEVGIDAIGAAFETARAVGATTVLNPAPARALPRELLTLVDLCVPNEHEAELLGGVAGLRAAGATTVIVTEGRRGASVTTPTESYRVDPFPVTPIDTTAAGDSFCGALAARIALGDPLRIALVWAAAAGALATTRVGAVPSVPHHDELAALVATR